MAWTWNLLFSNTSAATQFGLLIPFGEGHTISAANLQSVPPATNSVIAGPPTKVKYRIPPPAPHVSATIPPGGKMAVVITGTDVTTPTLLPCSWLDVNGNVSVAATSLVGLPFIGDETGPVMDPPQGQRKY